MLQEYTDVQNVQAQYIIKIIANLENTSTVII